MGKKNIHIKNKSKAITNKNLLLLYFYLYSNKEKFTN